MKSSLSGFIKSILAISFIAFLSSQIMADGFHQNAPAYKGKYSLIQYGAGLYDSDSATVTINVPGDIVAAYIDWTGVEDDTPAGDGTSVLTINGIEVEGALIPDEAGQSTGGVDDWFAWQADIGPGGYNIVTNKKMQITISGWDNSASKETNGATISIIYKDSGTDEKEIKLLSGADYIYWNSAHHVSKLMIFPVDPSDKDRRASFYVSFAGTAYNQTSTRGVALWMLAGKGTEPDYDLCKIAPNGKGYGINGGVEIVNDPFISKALNGMPTLNPVPDRPYETGHPYPGGAATAPYRALALFPAEGGYVGPEWSVAVVEVLVPANSSWVAFQFESEQDQKGESGAVTGASALIMAPQNKPIPFVSKDDDKAIMPDSGYINSYSLSYRNIGKDTLYSASLIDTLPPGLSYKSTSHPAETEHWMAASGLSVVKVTLGDLAPDAHGVVWITANVDAFHPEYLNKVYLTGKDLIGNDYWAYDDDLDVADSSSGSGDAGVESNGNLAGILLNRKLKILSGSDSDPVSLDKTAFSPALSLSDIIPLQGPFESSRKETSPFDILNVSNAKEVYASDYVLENGKRIAGVFSAVTTNGSLYEHTKAVCDRLDQYTMQDLKLVEIDGNYFYSAKLYNKKKNALDNQISFSVFESGGQYLIDNKWLISDYNASSSQYVYNFQVWSSSQEGTIELVKDIIANIKAKGSVKFIVGEQVDPDFFIESASYSHAGKTKLKIYNALEQADLNVTKLYRLYQGGQQLTSEETISLPQGESEIEITTGAISDAVISLALKGDGFADEVYVSGGSFTYNAGSKSSVSSFNISASDVTSSSKEITLAGKVTASGKLNDYVSVIRSFNANASGIDLSQYEAIKFKAKGNGLVELAFDTEGSTNYNYFSYPLYLSGDEKEYEISFEDLARRFGGSGALDKSKISLVIFMMDKTKNTNVTNFSFEISGITLVDETPGNGTGERPEEFVLQQNYPNPFNPSTVIKFDIKTKEFYSLKVYDIMGREIRTLVEGELTPGSYTAVFNGENLASGVYFYRLLGRNVNITKKMMFTK